MSMIQFNLLPDVKQEYLKAKRLKRLTVSLSFLFASACLIIAVLLFLAVGVAQKNNMRDLNKDITAAAKQVQSTPEINKIITVQNQLAGVTTLHNTKPAATRLFNYLSQVTPTDIALSTVNVDFVGYTFILAGTAKDLLAVNTLVDTLKFTTYTDITTSAKPVKAFSKVILSGFTTTDKGATYQIGLSFDPIIFDNQHRIDLTVPKTVTTRSQLDQPNALFQQSPVKQGAQ